MGNKIEHQGIIESIDMNHITVRILQTSACSDCHVKSLCSSSESKEKLIDIYNVNPDKYHKGDKVKVCGSLTMGRNAILLAFDIPLLLMILWVFIAKYLLNLQEGEIVVGIAILLSTYYFFIKIFDSKISKKFIFWIE